MHMSFYNCRTAPSIPHNVIIIVVAPGWTAAASPARSSPLAAFPGPRPRVRHKRLLAQGKAGSAQP
jgi:hypothetical protein